MSRALFLLFVLFIASHCKRGDAADEERFACGVRDPVKNLKWLNDQSKLLVGGPKINGIVLYRYNGNEVIEIQSSLASSTNMHQYSCNGVKLNLEDPELFKDYRATRTEIKVLYGTKLWP